MQSLRCLLGIRAVPAHGLKFNILLLQSSLAVKHLLSDLRLLRFQILYQGLSVFEVLSQSPLFVRGRIDVTRFHVRILSFICLAQLVFLLYILLNVVFVFFDWLVVKGLLFFCRSWVLMRGREPVSLTARHRIKIIIILVR